MKIRHVLAVKSAHVVTVGREQSLRDAVRLLASHRIGGLVVVDAVGAPVGVLSERDIVRALAEASDALDRRVGEIMSRDPVTGSPDDDAEAVLDTMTARRFRHLPIVDGGRLVGIVSLGDLVKHQMSRYEGEIQTLEVRLMDDDAPAS